MVGMSSCVFFDTFFQDRRVRIWAWMGEGGLKNARFFGFCLKPTILYTRGQKQKKSDNQILKYQDFQKSPGQEEFSLPSGLQFLNPKFKSMKKFIITLSVSFMYVSYKETWSKKEADAVFKGLICCDEISRYRAPIRNAGNAIKSGYGCTPPEVNAGFLRASRNYHATRIMGESTIFSELVCNSSQLRKRNSEFLVFLWSVIILTFFLNIQIGIYS